ncbi:MAG: kelch repeat-containing protein [Planctomycetota bacterium]
MCTPHRIARSCFVFAVLPALAVGQSWSQQSLANSPSPRRAGAMAVSPLSGGLLLYGGLLSGPTAPTAETWLWSGGAWQPLATATTPPPRWGHRMVYDSRRARLVTFGGRSPTTTATNNDTWEFDGVDWVQMSPVAAPNPRAFYSMAYDERRGVCVLYGTQSGSTFAGGDETWEYDGTTWTQVTTATTPPGLETPAMEYDKGRGVVVMFGGWNGQTGTLFDTTWEYDGGDWTQVATATTPPPRYRAASCYDDARGRMVVYGGFGSGTALQDTWEYDGNDWTQIAASGPPISTESYMAFDIFFGVPTHFGGSGPTGISDQTWTFSAPIDAIAAPYGQGCATSVGVPTLAPASVPQLGTTYQLDLANGALSSVGVVAHGLSNLELQPGVGLPLDLAAAGIAGCRLETSAELLITEVLSSGAAQSLFVVPATPALVGVELFSQALILDAAAPNGFGGLSNAVHGVLGN